MAGHRVEKVSQAITVNEIIKATSITVQNVMVGPNETVNLWVTTNPTKIDEKLTYESQDNGIARVDEDGKVTGVKEGITTITVKGEKSNITGTCEVMVSYVGYYADLDEENPGPEGIIYVDYAVSKSGEWSGETYSYESKSDLPKYTIVDNVEYDDYPLGQKMLKRADGDLSDTRRFLVMDLSLVGSKDGNYWRGSWWDAYDPIYNTEIGKTSRGIRIWFAEYEAVDVVL